MTKVLIGGPGSSGSSLLRIILNRHPRLLSGAELNFFNKEQIFGDWSSCKEAILGNRVTSFATQGWFPYPRHNLLHEDYGWQKDELQRLIIESSNLPAFIDCFFERALASANASIWIEKTPSNAYSFRHFLDLFSDGKVIHITRNPLDNVASLIRRGFTSYSAAGIWIYNNAAALAAASSRRYLRIKYEDFVSNPEVHLTHILNFIDVDLDLSILIPREGMGAKSNIPTWINNPNDRIKNSSIGAFNKAEARIQDCIINALSLFLINHKHAAAKVFPCLDCLDVCSILGYDFTPSKDKVIRSKLKRQMIIDWARRSFRFYPTGWHKYPGRLKSL